ncbi:MAG TPA: hypothetical protein V6D23_11115, partial [Candidatus Obscuribacterales bacterium]
ILFLLGDIAQPVQARPVRPASVEAIIDSFKRPDCLWSRRVWAYRRFQLEQRNEPIKQAIKAKEHEIEKLLTAKISNPVELRRLMQEKLGLESQVQKSYLDFFIRFKNGVPFEAQNQCSWCRVFDCDRPGHQEHIR